MTTSATMERTPVLPWFSSPVRTADGRTLPSVGSINCRWVERNFRLGRGDYLGDPLRLTSYQRRWIWRLYEFHPARKDARYFNAAGAHSLSPADIAECWRRGQRRYTRGIFGTGKGNGKTPFEGAVGAVELAGPTAPADPLVLMAASSLGQADLVFGDMKLGITDDNCPLKDEFLPFDLSVQLRDRPGEAKRVAAVAGSNDGPRATALLGDELHEWLGRLEDVFDVLDGAIGKRADAFEVITSTAGANKKSLLGRMYTRGVAIAKGEIVDDGTLFEWYEIPEQLEIPERIESDADLERWRTAIAWANPGLSEPGAGFLTEEYIRRRFDGAQTIPRFKWLRYHGNRWTHAEELWLPPGDWDARQGGTRPPAEGTEIVLGFSGTYNGDSAGLVGATVDRHVFALDAWEPPDGPAGLAYQVPREAVDAAVATAMKTYKVRRLVVNPNGWHGEAQTWGDRYGALDNHGRGVVAEFDWQHQIKRRADACSTFYTAVTAGTLTHDGDPRLARHLESAQTVEQKEGAYIARGGRDGVPIEMAVAAVMAFDSVASLPPPKKPGRFVTF